MRNVEFISRELCYPVNSENVVFCNYIFIKFIHYVELSFAI